MALSNTNSTLAANAYLNIKHPCVRASVPHIAGIDEFHQRGLIVIRIERICAVCGRGISWRRKWARDWENIKYCSDACRKRGLSHRDARVEKLILDLLQQRAADASLCPSEAAKIIADGNDWHNEMETVRMAARRLQRAGRILITQKGQPVNPDRAKGPLRLRLRKPQIGIEA
ncbi:MAG TPA: hypothetical protein DDY14_15160 [Chromatiaceae bacterium]|nr:MAG: DUF2256 and DUF3253 domain-containing protein [Thiohalocapsa sp. PB-PSB1]HBG96622.1 hypothetical protein [Chromatiaceae bacterium]HCS91354.1 hypothetical protein [Chromatiaceae bacterium]